MIGVTGVYQIFVLLFVFEVLTEAKMSVVVICVVMRYNLIDD